MATIVSVLSALVVMLIIAVLALIAHVIAINKELNAISKEQTTQNHDIYQLVNHAKNTALAVNDITVFLNDAYNTRKQYPMMGEGGDA